VGPLFAVLMFALALSALHHVLRDYRPGDIIASARAIPGPRIGLAAGLALLSYLALTCHDTLAVRYIRRRLAYAKIALASFISYAFSINLGFGPISGSAARYRLYSAWGLRALDVAHIAAFCFVTVTLGFLTSSGVSFLVAPAALPSPAWAMRSVGGVCLAVVCAYLMIVTRTRRPLHVRGWRFSPPPFGLSLTGVICSCTEWSVTAAVLYVLLPAGIEVSYPAFLAVFLLSQIIGLVSHVPGSLGVFESAVLLLLRERVETSALVGSLLVFRGIYYLVPFALALLLLGLSEILRRPTAFTPDFPDDVYSVE